MNTATIIQLACAAAAVLLLVKPAMDWWQARKTTTSTALATLGQVFQGEIVNTEPRQPLSDALKLLTCHAACEIDDPEEQAEALGACRILKKYLPPLPPARPAIESDKQAAIIAAVTAYNQADKYTAVG